MHPCSNCGNVPPPGSLHCDRCGAKMGEVRDHSGTRLVAIVGLCLCVIVFWFAYQNNIGQMRDSIHRLIGYTPRTRPIEFAPTPATTPRPQTRVTRANYERINEGMTFEQVKEILGPVEQVNYESKDRTGSAGVYRWGSPGEGFVLCQFQDGKLYSKSQISLKY